MFQQLLQEKNKAQQQKQTDQQTKKAEISKKKTGTCEKQVLEKKIEEAVCVKRILETILARQIEKRTDLYYDLRDQQKVGELEANSLKDSKFQKSPELLLDESNVILNINKIHDTRKIINEINIEKDKFQSEFEKGIKIRSQIIQNFQNISVCSPKKHK